MRFLDRKVPLVTPIKMKQKQVRSSPEGGNCEDGLKTARSFQLGHPPNWPSWSRVRSSSAIRRTGLIQIGGCRAGRVIDPARPSAELDWFSSADGRAGRFADPARPSAEMDWSSSADGRAGRVWFSSTDGRAVRVVDPARPSAELYWSSSSRVRSSSAIHRSGLVQFGGWPSWSRGQSSSAIRRAGRLVDPARPSADLDSVLCPHFNKTGLTYATR